MAQSKNWCFTLQASSEEDRVTWAAPGAPCPLGKWCEHPHFEYLVCQLEKAPETGQLHLQGYIQFSQNARLAAVKKLNDKAHWETRKKSHEAARDYCKKADTRVNGPWELGHEQVPKQGKRTDWADVSTKIAQGCTKKQVLLDHPHLAPCVRGIDALVDAHRKDPPLQRDMDIWYLYGPTNTGKTHRAMTTFPKAYVTKGKYFEGKTFDRYEGQEVLIMDEWSPYEWDLTLMNGLLDKWPCPLQCRYQNKDACWTKVIILSNFKPEECYPASNLLQRGIFDRRLAHKVEIKDRFDPVVDFGLGAAVPPPPAASTSAAAVDSGDEDPGDADAASPPTPYFPPSPCSPRQLIPKDKEKLRDLPPTQPWPGQNHSPSQTQHKDDADLCDPDLWADE